MGMSINKNLENYKLHRTINKMNFILHLLGQKSIVSFFPKLIQNILQHQGVNSITITTQHTC
jgi:hypothetical protein